MFFDQFPDMLEFCNQLKGSLLILGDFNIHFDRADSPATVRMNDLLQMFDLDQAVHQPTHSHGHIHDWIIHRQSDNLLQSTIVSHLLTSDHISVTCTLRFKVPKDPPVFKSTRNLKATDREAFKEEMERFVSQSPPLTQLTEFLKPLLDKYAPVTRKKVRSHRSSPWFAAVSEQLLDLKRQRRRAERRWLKSGLTVDRQIFSRLKQQVIKLVQQAKTTCRELFLNVNTLLGKAKPATFPITYTEEELSGVFSDFFPEQDHRYSQQP